MIVIDQVKRTYGRGKGQHQALKGISLKLGAGEVTAIIGTSGSGKTTLLNVLGGLDREWSGSVRLWDQPLEGLSDAALSAVRNEQIGFVFQHFYLLDHLTCAENVLLPSYFDRRAPKADLEARALEMLRKVGLEAKAQDRPTALSGGQKQRVAIARALFNQPRLILCDEPTGSLDRKTGLQIMRLFQRLVEAEGLTLVVVTHEEHVSRMAHRIVRLEDGEVRSDEANSPVMPEEQGQEEEAR